MSSDMGTIRLAGVVRESIVDGPGIRYVIFAQGCPHRCKGCHNEATLDFTGGKETEIEELVMDIGKNPMISGVTFSGGEPFSQPEGFVRLAERLKERDFDIVAYTGYTYEELLELQKEDVNMKALLENIDILIDGRFILEKRDLHQQFKGSSNQRYVDMNATREQGGIVVLESL